jgi:hypothetical protein
LLERLLSGIRPMHQPHQSFGCIVVPIGQPLAKISLTRR